MEKKACDIVAEIMKEIKELRAGSFPFDKAMHIDEKFIGLIDAAWNKDAAKAEIEIIKRKLVRISEYDFEKDPDKLKNEIYSSLYRIMISYC